MFTEYCETMRSSQTIFSSLSIRVIIISNFALSEENLMLCIKIFFYQLSYLIKANKIFPLFFFRSSHRRCSVRKGILRSFAKFTGKRLCQASFLINLQVEACNFIKKVTLAQAFPCEFCEIS